MIIFDTHTHNPQEPSSIISGSPTEITRWLEEYPDALFSVGIHPWLTADLTTNEIDAMFAELEDIATQPRVVAIGECGLDSLHGAPLSIQSELFVRHISLSERVGKPLVLHIVRQQDTALLMRRRMDAVQPWIWHAFRGTPAKAAAIIASAPKQYLSFGPKFNTLTPASIPIDRILLESDSPAGELPDINGITISLANALNLSPTQMRDTILCNTSRLFS